MTGHTVADTAKQVMVEHWIIPELEEIFYFTAFLLLVILVYKLLPLKSIKDFINRLLRYYD